MVTELLSKPKQSLDIELANMGVTDEAAQMDLDLYIGNLTRSPSFFAEPDQEKHNVSQKHIDLSISSIRFNGKSEET